jgi:tetratricopeptide (TPR) repeat protein
VKSLVKNLDEIKKQTSTTQLESQLQQMENEARTNPDNLQNVLTLGGFYLQMQQTNRAVELFDQALANPHINSNEAGFIAQRYAEMGNVAKLEAALRKIIVIAPDQPEPWYDIAALDVALGQPEQGLQDLRKALDLNARRLKINPAARDLAIEARKDPRFDSVRNRPDFQKIIAPN